MNVIDAIIGLPANLFFGTTIPVSILLCKKNRNGNSGNIFLIDASKEFEPGKNQNVLTDTGIKKILEAYKNRRNDDKFARVVTINEIETNGFNLNIPRYVDTYEAEEFIDITANKQKLVEIEKQERESVGKVNELLAQLGL